MSLVKSAYNAVFKRTSTYALAIVVGAFLFERSFDMGTELLYDNINKGKQWKDIEAKYSQS